MPSCSIIVSTYNAPGYLALVLEGLARQSDPAFETIVADDGSRSETAEVVSAYRGRLRLKHAWQADTGFRLAASRNNALAYASGELVAFLDGDCIPHPDYVADARRLMRPAGSAYVQGHRVILGEAVSARLATVGPDAIASEGIFSAGWALANRRALGNLQNVFRFPWPRRPHQRLRGVRGCSMVFRAEDLRAVNGFDEAFVGWGHEDRDVVRRLFARGVRRVDARGALVVYHLWHREHDRGEEAGNLDRAAANRPPRCESGVRGGWRGDYTPGKEGATCLD